MRIGRALTIGYLLVLPLGAQTTTPKVHLEIPATGGANWDEQLNANWNLLDGLLGNISNLQGVPISATAPTMNQGLFYDGTQYTPASLAAVARTGSYTDLANTPTIPAGQVNSDWNSISGLSQILNKPSLAPVATSGAYTDLSGRPSLSAVATSGSYNDLANKPNIPAAQVNSDWNSTSGPSQILNKPSFGSVTLENTFASPGSFTFSHALNSVFYQVHCVTRSGGGYAAATWSDFPLDANHVTVTVPSAGDYLCSFNAAANPLPDFVLAVSPASLLFEPTMTGAQHPTFSITQGVQAGYTGTVTYSTSGLASGMTGAYSPTTITGSGSSTLTLSFPASQTPGATTFSASGTDGTLTHAASPTITVGNINSGLVECWSGTDGSGTSFADSCGTSNTETLAAGAVTWQTNYALPGSTALFNSTARFTGTNQTATNFNGSTPFSVSAWVGSTSFTGSHTIISTLDTAASFVGWELSVDTTAHLVFFLNNVYSTNALEVHSSGTLSANVGHYVVVTYDGSKTAAGTILYIDGVAQTNTVTHNTLTGSSANTKFPFIGSRSDGSQLLGNTGAVAFIRIYNRALSQTDVSNYLAAGAR